MLFAFGFLPLLTTSVIYINVISIILLTLSLIFAFILYLKRWHYSYAVAFDLRALTTLSAISVLFSVLASGFALGAATIASIVVVFLAALFLTAAVLTAVKLSYDFLTQKGSTCYRD